MVKKQTANEHIASAKSLNLPISTKHSIEISREIRYKTTAFAKDLMEKVIVKKKPVAFKRFNNDMGHKAGMASGRFPVKAANFFLQLLKSVEANAQDKGLNVSNLKITKVISNKASIPSGGGRHRHGTKRTHIEIEVQEFSSKKKESKKEAKADVKKDQLKVEDKKEDKQIDKKVVEKVDKKVEKESDVVEKATEETQKEKSNNPESKQEIPKDIKEDNKGDQE